MKKLIFAALMVSASVSFAGTRENFNTCAAQDSSWMSRWGNYVVAFDEAGAQAVCSKTMQGAPYNVKYAGCYIGGNWAIAGYYCDEISPGG